MQTHAAAATAVFQEAPPCEVATPWQEDRRQDASHHRVLIPGINAELDRRKTAFWCLGLFPTMVQMKGLGPFPKWRWRALGEGQRTMLHMDST